MTAQQKNKIILYIVFGSYIAFAVLGKKETVLHSWTSQDIKTKHMANILRKKNNMLSLHP